ncbi:MAG: PAS domain S-box protein, partial [Dehalococcoidia bacterium]|nr:PAS domain S-box protein [Dehalococcoidia bacterium]
MPVVINGQTYYRTSEVCRMLSVSKNTLFRWLKDGVFSDIEYRDWRGWRIFTAAQVETLKVKTKHIKAINRDSQEKLQKMFESVTDGIAVIDLNGVITEVNQRTVEMHGFNSKDELLGKSAFELVAPRDHEKIAKNMRQALKQGTIKGVEYNLLRADGSEFPGELSTSVLKDASDNPVGHITIVRDITERKQMEEALRKIEQEKLAILNGMSELVVYQDTEHKILWTNEAAAESVGLATEQLVGRHCYEIWPKRNKPCAGCPVAKARETGEPQEAEITTPDGRVWFIRGYPIRDANGNIAGLVELTLEITERKQAEEVLQAEKNKLQSVINAMEDGLTMQDTDYNIIYQNEPLRKNYGDCLGEKCYRVYEGKEKLCNGCPVEKAFKDGKSHTSVRRVVLPSGEVAFGETTASPIRDAKGRIVSCLEIVRNINERKQAEEVFQAERNKLQSIIDAMEDGLTIQDKDYNIIYQNELVKTIFGDRLGEKCYRVYEGKEKLCDGCPVEKAFKDGKSHTSERRVVLPSGEVTFWENTANPIRDAKGRIVSCLEINRNITERKQTEEALADEATWRRILVEQSRDGIVILDQNGKVYEANQQFAEMLGYSLEEVRELHVWDWEYLFPREQVVEM